jgi:hypothetical protein
VCSFTCIVSVNDSSSTILDEALTVTEERSVGKSADEKLSNVVLTPVRFVVCRCKPLAAGLYFFLLNNLKLLIMQNQPLLSNWKQKILLRQALL